MNLTVDPDVISVVGCYVLDLYCAATSCQYPTSHGNIRMGQFCGRNWTQAKREATDAGWKIHPSKQAAFCPECAAMTPERRAEVLAASLAARRKKAAERREGK